MRERVQRTAPDLTTERIVDAAEQIATSESWEALSMRRVARALGRAPMSLYRHVSDLDHLRSLVAERLIERVVVIDHGEDWRRTLTEAATSMRATLVAHPVLLTEVMRSGMASPGMLTRIDVLIGALRRAGLPPAAAVRAYASVMALVLGSAVLERSATEALGEASPRPFVEQLTRAGGNRYPNIVAVAEEWGCMDGTEPFAFALDRLLDGIAALEAR